MTNKLSMNAVITRFVTKDPARSKSNKNIAVYFTVISALLYPAQARGHHF